MYCPNCNQEYEGKFCPECGTKLIDKPSTGGFNLKFGDANAISGGINLNDSHNVHNEDKSVHNISNVTNNITQVFAQKTEMEILQEKKALYLNECKRAYEDNKLEQAEVIALEEYRIKIGLDKVTADAILDSVRVMTERNARKTMLSPVAETKLKILTENLQKNEVKALMDQIDGLEALVNKYEHEELSRKYFLVLAALKPEKCIRIKENSRIDNYWKSFWSYLAYIKVGNTSKAGEVFESLDRFADFPEDNMTVLAIADALMNGNIAEAKAYLKSVTGDYTPALQRFVESLYLLLDPEMAKEMGADADACVFYLVNFFNIDKIGCEIVPCKYDDVGDFSESLAGVVKDGKYGYIDKIGREIVPCRYDDANDFSEGLASIEKDGKWGYIDKTGREVVPCKYDDANDFSEGLALVEKAGKCGYIDKAGYDIVPCKYDNANDFSEGLAKVEKAGKYGYIDKIGREIVPCQYEDAENFSEGLAKVEKAGKCGYIDKTGSEIVPCKYEEAENFSEGLAVVVMAGKCGYIDKAGREVAPSKYDNAWDFSESLAAVMKAGKCGYIDKTGREVVPCMYDNVGGFSEGLAAVVVDRKFGYIDKTGREVVPCQYDGAAEDFYEGFASIEKDGKWGYIDKTGREIVPCKYDCAWGFHEGLAAVMKDGKWGYIAKPSLINVQIAIKNITASSVSGADRN